MLFYCFFCLSPSKNVVPHVSERNFNLVDQIFQFVHRLDVEIEDYGVY